MSRKIARQATLPAILEEQQSRGAKAIPPPEFDVVRLAQVGLALLEYLTVNDDAFVALSDNIKPTLEHIIRKWTAP